jgi:hypothetical protein
MRSGAGVSLCASARASRMLAALGQRASRFRASAVSITCSTLAGNRRRRSRGRACVPSMIAAITTL